MRANASATGMSSSAESTARVRAPRKAAAASFVEPNLAPIPEMLKPPFVLPFVTAERIVFTFCLTLISRVSTAIALGIGIHK